MTKLNDIFDAMRAVVHNEAVQCSRNGVDWVDCGYYSMLNSLKDGFLPERDMFRIRPKTKMVPSVEMPSGYSSRGTTPYIDGPGDKIYVLQGTPNELLVYELARRALDGMQIDMGATGFSVTYEAKVKWTEVKEA